MSKALERIFRDCFETTHATRLLGGAPEPEYQPADDSHALHRIYYREDYFSSALHEVAHWCIAGDQRRRQVDYGYWYAPDGRSSEQQRAFEQVEVKPQAVEWHFSIACGHSFRISADNLNGDCGDLTAFYQAVSVQSQLYCQNFLPPRAQTFRLALAAYFGGLAHPPVDIFRQGKAA